MALMLPDLDDRRWAELVDVGRALIPVQAPEWTDHNVHDPGITLLELLAWIAETDIYRLNRVSDRHKLKFLALLGIVPRPPTPARTVLGLALKDNAQGALPVPEGIEFSGTDPYGTEIRFRSLHAMQAVAGRLAAVQLRHPSGKFSDLTDKLARGEAFAPFGEDPRIGTELYLAFDRSLPAGIRTVLYFVLDDLEARVGIRQCLIEEQRARWERSHRVVSGCEGDENTPRMPQSVGTRLLHHSVTFQWEFFGGTAQKPAWRPLRMDRGEVIDDTRSFTLDGSVSFAIPGEARAAKVGVVDRELWYVRCRLASGAFDAAPRVSRAVFNAVEVEQAVPVGHIVEIGHQRIEAVLLGTGSGLPNLEFQLAPAPVEADSIRVYSRHGGHWQAWIRRDDFDASKRNDRHFTLNAGIGVVRFGDGEHGSVPPKDAQVYAAYRSTSAEGGNLGAGRIDRIARSSHNVALLRQANLDRLSAALAVDQPVAASGGAPAESLALAIGRAVLSLDQTSRAATVDDYASLAKKVPGARITRVEVRPDMHPCLPCVTAQGVVTLLVLPRLPAERPSPSAGLLRLVADYLDARRLIGTRVEVVGPSYREVVIRATVSTKKEASKVDVQNRVAAALTAFLDPLRGGPDGTGWPLGRDVYRSEILQVINGAAGVDHVLSLELLADGSEPQCMRICIPATALVLSGAHVIQAQ